jgi:hypothetical protein
MLATSNWFYAFRMYVWFPRENYREPDFQSSLGMQISSILRENIDATDVLSSSKIKTTRVML